MNHIESYGATKTEKKSIFRCFLAKNALWSLFGGLQNVGQKGKKCVFVCFGMWVTSIMHLDNKGNEPTYLEINQTMKNGEKCVFHLEKMPLISHFSCIFGLFCTGLSVYIGQI